MAKADRVARAFEVDMPRLYETTPVKLLLAAVPLAALAIVTLASYDAPAPPPSSGEDTEIRRCVRRPSPPPPPCAAPGGVCGVTAA
jgi:hypothetical protein